MRNNMIVKLRQDERGVSAVLGAILVFLIAGAMWGTVQAYHVPNWNEDIEYEHINRVYDDMMTLKSDVEDVAVSGEPKTSNFHMGVRYPNRMFLANPGTGIAGSLTSDNVAITIVYTIDGLSNPIITTSYISNRIIYEVQGTVDSPNLVYEHGVIIRDYGSENATKDDQSLIVGDEIYIPVLTGNLTSVSSMETETIDIKPMSQSYSRTKIQSANITLSTNYPEVWEELLAGTSTADTTVQVDVDEGEINIVTTAVEQISFPAGDVTTDALYAGLATLSTLAVPLTYTSIDISQDYPCILNIDIAAVTSTTSTITATVKNVTAPFDIHADLTALTNDPEMYDVFPDYSSSDSIDATSWELPNQNTVRWTDITHQGFSDKDSLIASFWVINSENNMQFLTQRSLTYQTLKIFAFRGNGTKDFWRYNIFGDSWTSLMDAPANVGQGGSLAYDGNNYIYALHGNGTKDFWRYDISDDSWVPLSDAPANVNEGGSLAYDGSSYIYAFRGNSTTDFWRYDISGDSWTSLTDAPANVGQGGSLAYDGGDYIYAFRGNNQIDFWRYDISGDSWTPLTNAPANVRQGGSLAYDGSSYIYALRGNTTPDFWVYDISGDSWTPLTDAPANVKLGGSLVYDGSSYIYAFRGNTTADFWRYDISGDSWTSLTYAPANVNGGGSLCY